MFSMKSSPSFQYFWGSFFVLGCLALGGAAPLQAKTLPEFTQTSPEMWINSPPLTKADVAGKVVLIEIWTSV